MILKGTRSRSALDVARSAEDAGGGLESGADQEYGELRTWGLARHWPRLLELLYEVATSPRFADDEIERERAVLLAQIRGLEDQPAQVASRILSRALFGPRGYGLPTSGDEATVARITQASLVDRFRETYAADRLVLAVSGAVAVDDVLAEVGRLFEGLRPGSAAAAAHAPPDRPVRLRETETSPTQQAHVLLGYLAPSVSASDHVALKVANGVLGGGMSSRCSGRSGTRTVSRTRWGPPIRRAAGGPRRAPHRNGARERRGGRGRPPARGRAPHRRAGGRGRARAHQGLSLGLLRAGPPDQRTPELLPGVLRGDGSQAEYVLHYPGLLEAVDATDVLGARAA